MKDKNRYFLNIFVAFSFVGLMSNPLQHPIVEKREMNLQSSDFRVDVYMYLMSYNRSSIIHTQLLKIIHQKPKRGNTFDSKN